MPANFRGFASDVFLLRVGPEQIELKVQRDILTQIPYFAKALARDAFVESVELIFNLPDHDPTALSDVLWFTLVDEVPPIIEDDESYVQAYIAADRLMVDDIKSKILGRIVVYHQAMFVEPEHIVILSERNYHGSALYAFFIAQFAWDYWHNEHPEDISIAFQNDMKEDSGVSKLDLLRLLSVAHVVEKCTEPAESEFWLSGPDIEKHEDVSNSHDYVVEHSIDSGTQILKAGIQSLIEDD